MMRSLYAGVSGLQNHQIRMDVVGNNIANVNTIGYKRNRVTFEDILYQNMSGAAAPEETKGGVNPKQVGLGMNVAAIDTIHTAGALQTTGKITDLSVQGEGFFVLKDGEKTFFSRAGNFSIDGDNTLVNPGGMKVQGWQADPMLGEINTTGTVEELKIPIGGKIEARATSTLKYRCNLNSETPAGKGKDSIHPTTYTIYDAKGRKLNLSVEYEKVGLNLWRATTSLRDGNNAVLNVAANVNGVTGNDNPAAATSTFFVQFNPNGTLRAVSEAAAMDQDAVNTPNTKLSVDLAFTPEPNAPQQTVNIQLGTTGLLDGITQYADASSTKAIFQDGLTMGYLETIRIDKSGVITGIYSSGMKRQLGQVAMATFVNPGGLEKTGNTNFMETINSGAANVGPAGLADKGSMVAGALEMSNVDLADAFTDMIVTQRGFQANSRSITTSDQMIQELLTLKR